MKACLLLFFYFSLIGQLHGADVKIKENESVMGSTAMTYDLSEEKLMKLKYKSQHGDSEASFRLYQYYCFTKNNIDKQLRFLERSASQGNVTAQFNYGIFLSDTNPTLSEYYNLNRGTICNYLSGAQKSAGTLEDGTRLVWSYEEDYLRLSPEEIEAKIIEANKDWRLGSANSRARAIVCLNTREIFSTAKEASDKYGVERGNLSGRLSSKKPKSLGSLNGEKLTWRYLEDYNKMSEEDILEFIRVANEGNKGKNNPSAKSVICLNNLKIYDTMKEAEADTTAKGAEISNCCRGKKKTSKSYSWMYLSDYNKIKDMNMTIDELHKWKKNKYQKK